MRRDERVRARTARTEAQVLAAHEDVRGAVDEFHRLFEAPEAAAHAAGDELRERGRLQSQSTTIIRGNQRKSEAIRGHPRPEEAITPARARTTP